MDDDVGSDAMRRLTYEGRAVRGSRRSAGHPDASESTFFGLRSVPVQTRGSRAPLPQFPTIVTTASVQTRGCSTGSFRHFGETCRLRCGRIWRRAAELFRAAPRGAARDHRQGAATSRQ